MGASHQDYLTAQAIPLWTRRPASCPRFLSTSQGSEQSSDTQDPPERMPGFLIALIFILRRDSPRAKAYFALFGGVFQVDHTPCVIVHLTAELLRSD